MRKPKTLNQPVNELNEEELFDEIVYISEVALVNPKLAGSEVHFYTCRLNADVEAFPEGPKKDRIVEKLKLKKRFLPLLNNSGIIDLTGYGEHFF
jgi:hypothetical protein